jgi:plastocyanin
MTTRNVCLALALISAAACGGSYSSAPPQQQQPPGNTPPPSGGISVTNNAFSPATKTVTAGSTVQWAWNTCTGDPYGGSETCVSHNVTFDDGSASSPTQDKGTFSRSFSTAGTFPYHCTIHLMTGSITVQ